MYKPLLITILPALLILTGCHREFRTLEEYSAFRNSGVTINTVITGPRKNGSRYPAFLVVDGPGSEDMDRSTHAFRKTIRPLKDLADNLAKKGAVVLRFGKRTAAPGNNRDRYRFGAMISDAEKALAVLLKNPAVDRKRVCLVALGRSLPIALPLAKRFRFRKIILIGPVFTRIDRHIRFKLHYQIDFYNRHRFRRRLAPVINRTRQMLAMVNRALPLIRDPETPPEKKILGFPKQFWSDWIGASIGLEDRTMAVNAPILILYGTRDLEAPGSLIPQRTLRLRRKTTVRVKAFKGMRHDLYHNPTGSFMTPMTRYIMKNI